MIATEAKETAEPKAINKFVCSECSGTGKVFDDDDEWARTECDYCAGTGIGPLAIPEEFKADLEGISKDIIGRRIPTTEVVELGYVIGITNGRETLLYGEYSPDNNEARKERIERERRRAKAMTKIRDLWPEPPAPWPPSGPLVVDSKINTEVPIIAICGYSGAGKDTLASLLHESMKTTRIDDGKPLREAVQALYKLQRSDVYSATGKAQTITVAGKSVTVRKLLGAMGQHIESLFGEHVLATMAMERIAAQRHRLTYLYVCPSVRRAQAHAYREAGGFVIGMRRPGYGPQSEFDVYDESAVDLWIDNDGTIDDLKQKVEEIVVPALWNHFRADLRPLPPPTETAEASVTPSG